MSPKVGAAHDPSDAVRRRHLPALRAGRNSTLQMCPLRSRVTGEVEGALPADRLAVDAQRTDRDAAVGAHREVGGEGARPVADQLLELAAAILRNVEAGATTTP